MYQESGSLTLHTSQYKVRYYDTDLSTAVFFANYLKWFDSIAIIDFLRNRGIFWDQLFGDNMDAVVASVNFDYKSSVFLDDLLDITIEEVKIGNKSIRFSGAIYKHQTGELVAQGSMVYVIVEYSSRSAVPVPEVIREKLDFNSSI